MSIILKITLFFNFRKFQPQYSYKLYLANKKKVY